MKPNLLSSASSAVRASGCEGEQSDNRLGFMNTYCSRFEANTKTYQIDIINGMRPTCMELVVTEVERSVDGFERLKVNVNLMSIDRLNIRLLTRGCQQLSIFYCSSSFSVTKWKRICSQEELLSQTIINAKKLLSSACFSFWYGHGEKQVKNPLCKIEWVLWPTFFSFPSSVTMVPQ